MGVVIAIRNAPSSCPEGAQTYQPGARQREPRELSRRPGELDRHLPPAVLQSVPILNDHSHPTPDCMSIRTINRTLLAIIVIGLLLGLRAAIERRHLLAEQTRLQTKVGDLAISDPSKPHVRALPTGEEMHFAWHAHIPAGLAITWAKGLDDPGSSLKSTETEFLVRVRLRADEQGLQAFVKRPSTSGSHWLGGQELADLLHDHWGQIEVEQFGSDGVAVINVDQVTTVLRLTLPDDLKQEARHVLDEQTWKRIEEDIFVLYVGSDDAFQKARAKEPANGP